MLWTRAEWHEPKCIAWWPIGGGVYTAPDIKLLEGERRKYRVCRSSRDTEGVMVCPTLSAAQAAFLLMFGGPNAQDAQET